MIKAWLAYRATRKELSHLSLRDLRDIGLNFGDINRVARDAAAAHLRRSERDA